MSRPTTCFACWRREETFLNRELKPPPRRARDDTKRLEAWTLHQAQRGPRATPHLPRPPAAAVSPPRTPVPPPSPARLRLAFLALFPAFSHVLRLLRSSPPSPPASSQRRRRPAAAFNCAPTSHEQVSPSNALPHQPACVSNSFLGPTDENL